MNAHKMPTNSSSTPASPTLNAVSITHVSHSRRYTVVPNNRFILCSSSNDTEHVSGDWGSLKNTCSNAAVYLIVRHFFLVSVIFCDLFTLFRKSTQACSMPEHTHGGQGTALRRISCHLPCWRSLSPQFCCYALYSGLPNPQASTSTQEGWNRSVSHSIHQLTRTPKIKFRQSGIYSIRFYPLHHRASSSIRFQFSQN